MRQCIICFEHKKVTEFNKEHVFPETIGGEICIENVCKTCNGLLGKELMNLSLIILLSAALRIIHDLKRGNRKIKNSLKQYNLPNNDSYFEFRDKKIHSHLKPKPPKEFIKDGIIHIEYSMDIVDFKENTSLSMRKKVAERFGVSIEKIGFYEKRIPIPAKEVTFLASNKPLIMEAAKIAYELFFTLQIM
ncbi:MAG: hypothetical protein IPJ74_20395 [Saprospiraceae bacterium]|nr:hypothetical protein [Saprospiraceae bacterium]